MRLLQPDSHKYGTSTTVSQIIDGSGLGKINNKYMGDGGLGMHGQEIGKFRLNLDILDRLFFYIPAATHWRASNDAKTAAPLNCSVYMKSRQRKVLMHALAVILVIPKPIIR